MMKDRFRFRAWDKSFQKYCENVIVSTINGEITVYERLVNGNTALIPHTHVVLEQCTCLKDKNGRLIYEGDILKTVSGRIVEVKFGKTGYNSEFTFCSVGFFLVAKGFWGEDYINFRENPYYEVIGNIHENPELLEGKNEK